MTERLPLSEKAFRALEDAYEKQHQEAHSLHQQQSVSTPSSARTNHLAYSASVAATEMQRLLTETRQLHRRFRQITANAGPPFSEAECNSLSLLGFDVSRLPVICRQYTETTGTAGHRGESQARVSAVTEANESGKVESLKRENAQLLSAVAWYRFREGVMESSQPTSTAANELFPSFTSSPNSSSEFLKRLYVVKALSESLCSCPTARTFASSSPSTAQSAVDVAIQELLDLHHFPPQVRVERVKGTQFYMIDRPVVVAFAAPQSSTLVVQDPEGLEEDTDLRAYLMYLYAPLLRALRWKPPELSDAAATHAPGFIGNQPLLPLHEAPLSEQRGVRRAAREVSLGASALAFPASTFTAPDISLPPDLQRPSTTPSRTVPPNAVQCGVQRSLSIPQSTLSQMTYDELVALKRATLQRLRSDGMGALY